MAHTDRAGSSTIGCLVVSALIASAAAAAPPAVQLVVAEAEAAAEATSLSLRVSPAGFAALWQQDQVEVADLPLPGADAVDLMLEAFDVLSPGAVVVAGNEHGVASFEPPEMRFFRGHVAGDDGALAFLWLRAGRVGGIIRMPATDGLYVLGPGSWRFDTAASREHTIARVAAAPIAEGSEPLCATDPMTPPPSARRPAAAELLPHAAPLRANLAVDATVEYFELFGDLADATAYAFTVVGAVSAIYERDAATELRLAWLRVFTAEPDPYTCCNRSLQLDELATEWGTNPAIAGLARATTHLFTAWSGGGIANIEPLCEDDTSYAVSSLHGSYRPPTTGFASDLFVVGHELGHAFGSPHTHCYVPEIDRCATQFLCYQGPVVDEVGTIMSYCHLQPSGVVMELHPRVVERIRDTIEAAPCIEGAGAPGRIATGGDRGLKLVKVPQRAELRADDGTLEGGWGASGTARGSWIKRFTPPCLPYRLTHVEAWFDVPMGHHSDTRLRDIRALVYVDPAGTGAPSNATLTYAEDVVVHEVSRYRWNRYRLRSPLTVTDGDLYLGFADLVADPEFTRLAYRDDSRSGDSYHATDSTDPSSYELYTYGTWLIRGHGDCGGPPQAVRLTWSEACNQHAVPWRDFGVYEGTLGSGFADHAAVTCSTGRRRELDLPAIPPGAHYYAVVPNTSVAEGSYGSLAAAAVPCRPQQIGPCD